MDPVSRHGQALRRTFIVHQTFDAQSNMIWNFGPSPHRVRKAIRRDTVRESVSNTLNLIFSRGINDVVRATLREVLHGEL